MTIDTFSEREKSFENKFRQDEEARFKIHAKAVSLFGMWGAGQLGLKGAEASAYARKIIESDIDTPNAGGIVRKVQQDLKVKGIDINERQLHNQFNAYQEQARQSLMKQ